MVNIIKFLFKVAVIILAIIGFQSIGGLNFVQEKWDEFFKPSQEELIEKTKKIADLSEIPDEYTIDKSMSLMGYKLVLAEHNASGQKMIIMDPNSKDFLVKEDFKSKEKLDRKVKAFSENMENKFIRLEHIKITGTGNIRTMGQVAPYAKFEAEAVNLPMGEMKGFFGVVQDKEGNPKVFISANSKDKYSQIIANQFFAHVK